MSFSNELQFGEYHKDFPCSECRKTIKKGTLFLTVIGLTHNTCISCFKKEKNRMKKKYEEKIKLYQHNLQVMEEFERII